jgi:phosphoserine phosphatase
MSSKGNRVARVLVFDVNDTLLDLAALRDPFARAFGDAAPLDEWFARLLHGSLVATLTDTYQDFATIARNALDAVGARRGRELSSTERDAILETLLVLPAHPRCPMPYPGSTRLASRSPRSPTRRVRWLGHSSIMPAS